MSVIRKKPEINKIIEALNDTEKAKLAAEVDNEAPLYTKSLINKNYYFSPLSNNTYEIAGILLELAPTNTVPGIVIRTNNNNNLREFFIQISYKQKLIMWRLNTINRTAKMIEEDLNINELRRLLEEVHDHIIASEIDSGSEPANKVLASDGDGGAEWKNAMDTITPETVESGSAVQLFGFDSEGNLVKDDMPEGIVVDDSLDTESNNAIANKPVAEKFAQVDEALDAKANVDGNYPTMTVGVADNLSPYDESSGADQDTPFSFQATGAGNGSQPDFSTGEFALMKEKQGNTVVVNQLARPLNASNWDFQDANGSFSDGVATFTANATDGQLYHQAQIKTLTNHKYIFVASIKTNASANEILLKYGWRTIAQNILTSGWQLLIDLLNQTKDVSTYITIIDARTSNFDAIQVKNVGLIDLTQWFNGDIPQDILDNPSNFFRYYQGSLAYNKGELVNSNGQFIKCIGMNQWDEVVEPGSINSDGSNQSNPTYLRSKNYIPVISNATYYFKCPNVTYFVVHYYDADKKHIDLVAAKNQTRTTPANCAYIRFYLGNDNYGTTYNHDISINLYYANEPRCLTYEPYEVLTNNDTGTETLRSAGSGVNKVKDYKLPNGEIHRLVGNRAYQSGDENDSSLITDGTTTNYPLAEPTTEQGTTFSENLEIDDFGSMDFGGDNGVPQGNLIFYPVDYKAFIDTLYNYTDGTPSNIALKSDLAVVDAKIGAKIPECPTTTDGTYVLKATVSDGEVVYSWVLEE